MYIVRFVIIVVFFFFGRYPRCTSMTICNEKRSANLGTGRIHRLIIEDRESPGVNYCGSIPLRLLNIIIYYDSFMYNMYICICYVYLYTYHNII